MFSSQRKVNPTVFGQTKYKNLKHFLLFQFVAFKIPILLANWDRYLSSLGVVDVGKLWSYFRWPPVSTKRFQSLWMTLWLTSVTIYYILSNWLITLHTSVSDRIKWFFCISDTLRLKFSIANSIRRTAAALVWNPR